MHNCNSGCSEVVLWDLVAVVNRNTAEILCSLESSLVSIDDIEAALEEITASLSEDEIPEDISFDIVSDFRSHVIHTHYMCILYESQAADPDLEYCASDIVEYSDSVVRHIFSSVGIAHIL